MSFPGGWELLIILLFVLIFFGAKRLPEMARGLGKGIREFKSAVSGITDEVQNAAKIDDKKETNNQTQSSTQNGSTESKTEGNQNQ